MCNRPPHSAITMETPYTMLYGKNADLAHLRIIAVRACFQSKDATSLVTRRGNGRFAASARVGATHSVSGTPRRVELSNASSSSSLKHHLIGFPLSGGFRRCRYWKLEALPSATTASTTTTLHAKTWYRQCETTQILWTSTLTALQNYLLCKPRPGVFAWGSHTA